MTQWSMSWSTCSFYSNIVSSSYIWMWIFHFSFVFWHPSWTVIACSQTWRWKTRAVWRMMSDFAGHSSRNLFLKKCGPLNYACISWVPEPDLKVMQCKIMNITGIFRTPVFVTLATNILIYITGVLLLTPHERVVLWFCFYINMLLKVLLPLSSVVTSHLLKGNVF
jgi:hypothetical protein